jgi:hypothetical protein
VKFVVCGVHFALIKSSGASYFIFIFLLYLYLYKRDNPVELGLDFMGRRNSNVRCLITSVVAAEECRCLLLWSKRNSLDSKPLCFLHISGFTLDFSISVHDVAVTVVPCSK